MFARVPHPPPRQWHRTPNPPRTTSTTSSASHLNALELLDLAVGRTSRLPIRDREQVREYLMPARNHLRNSTESLRQKLERESNRRAAARSG